MTSATLPFIQTKPKSADSPPKTIVPPLPRELTSCLSFFSPFPIYILLLSILKIDPVCSPYQDQLFWLIFGIAFISESMMVTLLFPASTSSSNSDIMDFEENDRKNEDARSMTLIQKAHGYLTALALPSFSVPILSIFVTVFPSNSCIIPALPILVLYVIFLSLALLISAAVIRNTWITRMSDATCLYSILTLLLGSFFMIWGWRENFDNFYLTVGLFVLLGFVLHMRFAHFYLDPPKNGSKLTQKVSRSFLKVSFGWILSIFCMIWSALHLLLIMDKSSPKDTCLEQTATALFVFIGLVPTAFVVITIINNVSHILKARC